MRLIVVGGGRVGLALLEAAASGDEVALVDVDPARAERARARFPRARVVEGDATDEAVLREAGAPDADALVAATPDDPTNLMVCALARRIGVPNAVARVSDEDAHPLFAEIGATPVRNPSHLTAEHLYHRFEAPGVRSFLRVGEDAEIATLVLGAASPLAGKPVREADFPAESLLVAVNRGGRVLVPSGELVLQAGDVLTMLAKTDLLEQLVVRLAGKPGRHLAKGWRAIRRGFHAPHGRGKR